MKHFLDKRIYISRDLLTISDTDKSQPAPLSQYDLTLTTFNALSQLQPHRGYPESTLGSILAGKKVWTPPKGG